MTKKQRAQLHKSLETYGFLQPLVVNSKMVIINGNQKMQVILESDTLKSRFSSVPCLILPDDTSKEDEMLICQSLNKIHGEHSLVKDSEIFAKLLQQNRAVDLEAILGKKEQSILNIIGKGKEAAEPTTSSTTSSTRAKLGDIWQLGKHIIVCGDNQTPESWAKLPKADIVFTSPPYNVGTKINRMTQYKSGYDPHDKNSKHSLYVKEKTGIIQDYPQFLANLTKYSLEMSKYLFINIQQTSNNRIDWITYLYEHRKHFVDKIVWYKRVVMPRDTGILRNVHEDILIFACDENPPRKIDTLDDATTHNYVDVSVNYSTSKHITDTHKATFPVDLPKWIISHFVPAHGTVIDPCLGTGTTIMAAEMTGRTAYGIEIEPTYVDYCLHQFEKHTGTKAEKVKQ